MQFRTQAQADCYQKVATWMDSLFDDTPWEPLDEPGFGLFMGSAWVEIHIHPWDDDDTFINVKSVVVRAAQLDEDLLRFLLDLNAELLFGAFAINPNGDILFQHTIVGSTCDPTELEASAREVLEVADEYDDQIVIKWGGERALDQRI